MPRHKPIIDHNKRLKPDLIVFLHCCGSIYQLLPDLIEAGVQVINPVQISAKDMEPQRLKSEFGRDITFWGGGCDTQKVLPWASVQEIRDHVRRNLDIWSPGGGYIFCAVHNILAEVEPDKVEAMYDAAHGYSD
jgi:uroporphyrinogen decarboxylase